MSPDNVRDEAGEGEAVYDGTLTTGDPNRICLRTIDWTYQRRYLWTETGEKLPSHPRPPCYNDLLIEDEEPEGEILPRSQDEDIELNPALVGASGAENVVKWYEVAVAIANGLDQSPDFLPTSHRPLYLGELSDDESAVAHSQWAALVNELLSGIIDPSEFTVTLDPEFGTKFMTLDTTTLSDTSMDSDSDPVPTTPDADSGFAHASFGIHEDDSIFSHSPSKPLNAAASSFVPSYSYDSFSPPPSAESYDLSAYEFHFPSLTKQTTNRNESRSVPPPLQRDEHGFYTEVASASVTRSSTPRRQTGRTTSRLIDSPNSPSRSRSTSKTRELVDQLRSSAPSRRQRKKGEVSSLRHSSMDCDGDSAADERAGDEADGWFMGTGSVGGIPGSGKQEGWVQGLFQCRSPSQSHTKKKSKHERSSSTSTVYTTSTPTSASSHLSTLPSPVPSINSIRPPSKPPVYSGPPLPLQSFVPFAHPFVAYPAMMPPGMVPPSTVMQLPPQAWRMPLPPAMYPTAMPMFVHRA